MNTIRTFTREFKIESAKLVTEQGYTVSGAAKVADVSPSLMAKWVRKLRTPALAMAYWKRKPVMGLIHHSDRDSQYASSDYQGMLKAFRMIGSMSRKGNCYDNSVTESFFHTLKVELVRDYNFINRAQAKSKIFLYIEEYYNQKRKHSTLGYCSPNKFEQRYEMVA